MSLAGSLAEDFDRSFSQPHREAPRELEDFLAVRAGGESCAIPLKDVAAVAAGAELTPLPSRRPELLGLIGHRGVTAAAFSLAALLGAGSARSAGRWFALLKSAPGLALAFEEYEGHLRVSAAEVFPLEASSRRRHLSRGLRVGGGIRLIVDVASVRTALSERP